MEHEPGGLLRDLDILGELDAGDALLVRRGQPDRHVPFLKPDLRVLEDRADLDREPLTARRALVGAPVGEVVDVGRAAVGAIRAVGPADRTQMVDAGLFVGNACKREKRLSNCWIIGPSSASRLLPSTLPAGSSTYIVPYQSLSCSPRPRWRITVTRANPAASRPRHSWSSCSRVRRRCATSPGGRRGWAGASSTARTSPRR